MTRLRTVSPDLPGWTRRRAGRGFVYLDAAGRRLDAEQVDRIRALVIPPAWSEVWICPVPNGHLQAVGTDAAGRRQYLYHPAWRRRRDLEKFSRARLLGRRLPVARARILTHLELSGMPQERACAVAVRLLDLGYFRIGNDVYADRHGSFGLTTLQRSHVRRRQGRLLFEFVGKSGVEHLVEIEDPLTAPAIETMRRRRTPEDRLLAYRDGAGWRSLDPATVNDYIRAVTRLEVTAKDFRTWHATVLAAVALADSAEPGTTVASRRRAVSAAMKEVAGYLGNTPTMARSSYVDPVVVERYQLGRTIARSARRRQRDPDRRQQATERAVLRLLADG